MLEVELRSFITKEQFDKLLEFFKQNGTLEKEDYQESFYFDCSEDLRIQRNNFGCKIWLKKGKIHDDSREEIEIKFPRDQFETLERLFLSLGMNIEIKWFRDRKQFQWNGIKVCLDYTKGYGHIIELEKLCTESESDKALEELNQKFSELEFEKKFKFYKENWKTLIN